MRKDIVRVNVVIYPPVEVAREAMAVSRSLAPFGDNLILDGIHRYPRVTLYSCEIDSGHLEEAAKLLDQISALSKPFSLRFKKYTQTREGYIFAALTPRHALLKLQTQIIRALNPLRARAKLSGRLAAWEKNNLIRYGYRWVGAKFEPHLTFAHLKPERLVKDLVPHLPKHKFSFTGESAYFCIYDQEKDAWKNFQKFKFGND